ncbi:MAG TPA: AAA family ATPase, partial [Mycobacteriales bacterium]|nr:AAA family ATPase [Mycobacteriales bacterium]
MALETVCLVFTDLVGSTELANRIGPTPAEALRKEHFALLRTACADAGGREVKNLGDGLMLAFGSATAALEAAAQAQRAIAARNRRAEIRYDVRVGVALGEVESDSGDYFGEPVVQAARLCAMAEGGQVLVTDHVKLFANSTRHGFSSVGLLELKGLSEPVAAHALVWDELRADRLPLPNRLRGAPELVYVGRTHERAILERGWHEATEGRASLVLLGAEPGMGKTRLASHHAFGVHEAGGVVLYGAIDEGAGVPYQAWIEALSHYVSHVDDGTLDRCLETTGADLARLLPAVRSRRPDLPNAAASDGETDRYLLFEAVTAMLRVASRQAPVLVIVDDLHWADKPTLLMLLHLHRALADSAIQFIGTYRDSELPSDHPLADMLATLRREERITRLSLAGLDEAEIMELLIHASGQDTTPDGAALAGMLVRDTAGNPLFVAEVLRDLLEQGHIALSTDGQWGLATGVERLPTPDSVRDVVEQRVRRLGAEAHRVLTAAAVIGREFELDLLAMVAEVDPGTALDTIEAAIAGSIVTEAGARPGLFRFVHALIAQTLTDVLTSTRRASLHHRIGAAIQTLHGDNLGERIAAVARHQLLAGDDPRKVADTCRRAGTYALEFLAPDEALRWFESALIALDDASVDDDALRCDLLADIGTAMRDAGDPQANAQLKRAAESALALRDGERMARPLLTMNRSLPISVGIGDNELIALLDAALDLNRDANATRARLLAARASESGIAGDFGRRRVMVEDAIAIARTLDDATLAAVLTSSLGALLSLTTLDIRAAYVAEARQVSEGSDLMTRLWCAAHMFAVALETADREALNAARADLHKIGVTQPLPQWITAGLDGVCSRIDGDLAKAEQICTDGLALATDAGIADGFALFSLSMNDIRLTQGRAGELADLMLQAVRDNPAMPLHATLAGALTQGGRLAEAEALLQAAVDADLTKVQEGLGWAVNLHDWAVTANRCRH